MGVYIKNMEMPTTCGNCWFCHAVGNDKWHCRLSGKSFSSWSVGWGNENNTGENGQHPYIRRDDCPLVPVPPHGRLIDADALRAKQQEDADLFQGSTAYGDKCRRDEAMNAVANIVNAPTIIPAEEEWA